MCHADGTPTDCPWSNGSLAGVFGFVMSSLFERTCDRVLFIKALSPAEALKFYPSINGMTYPVIRRLTFCS